MIDDKTINIPIYFKSEPLEIQAIGGLFTGDNIPYYCLKISAEKFKELKGRKLEIYKTDDGDEYFKFLNNEGNDVGDKALFLIWR